MPTPGGGFFLVDGVKRRSVNSPREPTPRCIFAADRFEVSRDGIFVLLFCFGRVTVLTIVGSFIHAG